MGEKRKQQSENKKRKWDLSPHISNYIKCKQS